MDFALLSKIAGQEERIDQLEKKIKKMKTQQQKAEVAGKLNLRLLAKLAKKVLPFSPEDHAILDGVITELED